MNHVINLAVQDFLKSIKAIKTNADGLNYVEEDRKFDGLEPMSEGFALALYKIRTITKVIQYCRRLFCLLYANYSLMFRKLPQARFALNVSVNVVNLQSSQC